MILGNEERTIRLCMDSLMSSNCFDEFVVVHDTRTSDQTPEILEGYRAQFPGQFKRVWHKWKKLDYAAARNAGLKHATADRLYWHDGDEIMLDPEGFYSLLQEQAPLGFHIWNVSPTPDNSLVWTHQLRLFPNLTGVKWELPIHEQVTFSLRDLGVQEQITNLRIWHLGYTDETVNARKHLERARAMEEWLREHPKPGVRREYIMQQYSSSMRYLQNMQHRR